MNAGGSGDYRVRYGRRVLESVSAPAPTKAIEAAAGDSSASEITQRKVVGPENFAFHKKAI